MAYNFKELETVIGTEAATKLISWLGGGGSLYVVEDESVSVVELALLQKNEGIGECVVVAKNLREVAALLDPMGDWSEWANTHAKCLKKMGWFSYPSPVRWKRELVRVWTKYPMTNAQIRKQLDDTIRKQCYGIEKHDS